MRDIIQRCITGSLKKSWNWLIPFSSMIRDRRSNDMLGHKGRDQLEFFITGSLEQLIPDEHVLVQVDRVLDLSWLREEVADCYCPTTAGRGLIPR